MRLELTPDLRFTLIAIEDDEVLEQPGLVVVEHLDLDRAASASACRQEAMTVRVRSRPDVLHQRTLRVFRSPDDERDDAATVEKNQPANRPREDEVALAVLEIRVPSHLLWKGEVAKQASHHVREDVHGRLAALAHPIGEIGPLRRVAAFERADVDAVFPGKAGCRRRRLTVRFE